MLAFYSADKPTPRQFDALKELLKQYKADRGFAFNARFIDKTVMARKVLVFGSVGPEDYAERTEFQYTISFKQLESKANVATLFYAALDNYFGVTKGLDKSTIIDRFTPMLFLGTVEKTFDLSEPIAVDVETGGILGVDVTPRTAMMLSVSLAQGNKAAVLKMYWKGQDGDKYRYSPEEHLDCIEMLKELLPKIEKPIFHNGKFDIAVIESNIGVRMPNWFDTMLAHHVLNIAAREHGLKALCARYFNASDWDRGIKGTKDYADINPDQLAQYSALDVLWTYRLWEYLAPLIEADESAQTALYLEMQMADFLMEVEEAGIPVSTVAVNELRVGYKLAADMSLTALRDYTDNDFFNPGSPLQVKNFLERELGKQVPSTKEEVIEDIKNNAPEGSLVYKFCVELIGYRKAVKMMGTYLTGWSAASRIVGDNRVHPTFHVHGTTTGRLASSNPNAQNVPRDKTIRKMVTLDGTNELI